MVPITILGPTPFEARLKAPNPEIHAAVMSYVYAHPYQAVCDGLSVEIPVGGETAEITFHHEGNGVVVTVRAGGPFTIHLFDGLNPFVLVSKVLRDGFRKSY